jgi:hypothetical protein
MKSLYAARSAVAAALLSVSGAALAAGDSGTSSVGEMQVSGGQFLMMVGGLVGLGLAVWVLTKFLAK